MKIDGYSFPHPVLGIGDDINGKTNYKLTLDSKTDKIYYLLNIEYVLENKDLNDLINNKEACFLCEINCSGTLYRKSEICFDKCQEIKIPKNYIRGKVELIFVLISTKSNNNYCNSSAHKDFDGYNFNIEIGDVLAFIGENSFVAEIDYSKLNAVSSFMEILKGEYDQGEFIVLLNDDKIKIKLSKEDYRKYCDSSIGRCTFFASTFHSSLVLSSLIHALYQLCIDNSEYSDKLWAKQIEERLKLDECLDGLKIESDNVLKIAQLLLGNPISRLLEDLFSKNKNFLNSEFDNQ